MTARAFRFVPLALAPAVEQPELSADDETHVQALRTYKRALRRPDLTDAERMRFRLAQARRPAPRRAEEVDLWRDRWMD